MKTVLSLIIIFTLLNVSSARAETGPGTKLVRGVVNVLTAPVEIPKQTRAYWIEGAQKTDHILVWIGSGFVWGVVQAVKRAGSGAWDAVSFPFENPAEYKPVFEPEYVFDQWPRNPVSGR